MAQPQEPPLTVTGIRYLLSLPQPHTHLFEVQVRVPSAAGPVELVMPSWTPGSYLLREFARHVQDFTAHSDAGEALAWRKLDKNTWRIEAPAGDGVRASYRVYANELTVRTSHLDASHGYVNGASVFMLVRGREAGLLEVEIDAPEGWRVTCSLPAPGPRLLRARDYDELVDSPIEIGTHELVEWEQEGLPHRYAVWGRADFDRQRLVADTRRIIEATRRLFGDLPYRDYTFILHLLPEGRGGLEHGSSCSLQAARSSFQGEEYENLLALVAHEFFHVWNAKRIRPEPLGPFDYTRENYTRNLWVVEGFTTYYTDLILRRAGIVTPERYLARLGDSIGRMQALPGRHHQSLEEASFDAWIKFYRPDEHTPNSQVSYYHKGALVALLLDMEIRRATGSRRSLDDLMRLLWERYGVRDIGFPEEGRQGIQALAEEVCGASLEGFFDAYVRGTEELDYDRHLPVVGLRVRTAPAEAVGGPGLAGTRASPTRMGDTVVQEVRLGVRTREQEGRVRITHVLEGTPAHQAGINAGDELVAVDGVRIAASGLPALLQKQKEGARVVLTLLRRDELLALPVRVGPHPAPRLELAKVEPRSAAQRSALEDWLHTEVTHPGVDQTPVQG